LLPNSQERAERLRTYPEGTRVRAEWFPLDKGLRLWHDQSDTSVVRVVKVHDRESFDELMRGTQQECERAHPDARWGINDNESVPPGTEGTVVHSDGLNVAIKWDNGSRLHLATEDRVQVIA
jgi:hypothetical protein